MMSITSLCAEGPQPVPRIDREIDDLSAEVSRRLAGAGAENDDVRDLGLRLCRVEDALAGLRAGKGRIVERMVTFVCFAIGTRPTQLISERRTKDLAYGRFAIMWAARQLTNYSYPRIGHALGGFDHTSVIHGIRRAEQLRETEPDFRALTDAMIEHFTIEEQPDDPPTLPFPTEGDRHV